MQTILVINGEMWWQDHFPDHRVERKRIQETIFVLREGTLLAVDANGICEPSAILWRVGAIKPDPAHRAALDLIRLSGIPCVNDAKLLSQGYDRLAMLATLQDMGMPVLPFRATTHCAHLKNIGMAYPFVVKAGNFHGGYGKVLVEDDRKWQEVQDLIFMNEGYATVEPYVPYQLDIRYLVIGDKVWSMARRGKHWKANVQTTDYMLREAEPEWIEKSQMLRQHLGADILALDVLKTDTGENWVLEYNDIPGLSGFPEEVKTHLANCVLAKMAMG